MDNRIAFTVLAAIGAALAGCAGSDTTPATTDVVDSAGVVLFRNFGELVDSSAAPRVTPDLRIGMIEGPEEYQFGQIVGIAEDSGRNIYVLDRQSRNVRVFDPSGQYVRTIGRSGQGPGELERPVSLLVVSGDTLHVLEGNAFSGWRLHRFAPDGSLIETRNLPGGGSLVSSWAISPDGAIIMQASRRGAEARLADILLRRNPETQAVDTLRELPPPRPELPVAYDPTPIWTVLHDGRLVLGRTDEYRLEFLNPTGNVARVVTRDIARRYITDAEKAAIIESRREQQSENLARSASPQMGGALRRQAEGSVADAFPYYTALMPGPRGTLWVLRFLLPAAAGGEEDGMHSWDVFADEGRLLGSVRLEATYPLPWGTSEHVYQVVRDTMGVQYIQRLRVDWGAGG
jgi:hypothetical protein